MKKILLTLVLAAIMPLLHAQLSLASNFNATVPGIYFTVGPEYTWFHQRLGIGLVLNQTYASGNNAWLLRPAGFNDRFGVNLNYKYVFYPNQSDIEPYFFFDANYQYCGRKLFPPGKDYPVTLSDPYGTLTETIGIGFTTDIYRNFYFDLRAGVGLVQEKWYSGFDFPGGATYKTTIGLGYRFGDWRRK